MGDPGDAGFEEEEVFDLDAVVWLPGVDYLSGWREAQTAADELAGAPATIAVQQIANGVTEFLRQA
ncbi:hypothetical protein [Streptomyces sp. B5E4]|uniref:hypothetical protein n=1 Tax=Streptomyces sp. B5E4 TaxID=3153568 RepID=UPI00325C9B8C